MTDTKEQILIEACAKVIAHMLGLMPTRLRAAVLDQVAADEAQATRRQAENRLPASNDKAGLERAHRYESQRPYIMRFKAAIICTFVRDIVSNHNPQVAAHLLFDDQPHARGSGRLRDYLKLLPGVHIDESAATRTVKRDEDEKRDEEIEEREWA